MLCSSTKVKDVLCPLGQAFTFSSSYSCSFALSGPLILITSYNKLLRSHARASVIEPSSSFYDSISIVERTYSLIYLLRTGYHLWWTSVTQNTTAATTHRTLSETESLVLSVLTSRKEDFSATSTLTALYIYTYSNFRSNIIYHLRMILYFILFSLSKIKRASTWTPVVKLME